MDDTSARLDSVLGRQSELQLAQSVRGISGANALQKPQNALISIVGGATRPM